MARTTRKTKIRKDLLEEVASSGASPVEIMVLSMRMLYKQYESCEEQAMTVETDREKEGVLKYGKGCLVEACEIAKHVAPYFHPKLQSMTLAGDPEAAPIKMDL